MQGGGGGDALTLHLQMLNKTYTLDCNPVTHPQFASLVSGIKSSILWGAALAYLLAVFKTTEKYLVAVPASNQASAVQLDLAGFSVGWTTGLLIAAGIMTALAAIPGVFFTWIGTAGGMQHFVTNTPPSNFSGAVIYLFDAFIPWVSIMGFLVSWLAYRLNIAGVYWLATTIVRFIFGG